MKHLKILSLLPTLCLASCSNSSYVGTYEFRLGKTDGSHLGLTVELTDEDMKGHDGMKKMYLSASLGKDFDLEKAIEEYTEDDPMIAVLVESLAEFLPKFKDKVDAYYGVTDIVNSKYGNRVKVGSDIIKNILEDVFPDLDIDEELGGLITPEMIEMVACAYINNTQFTFQIPVSVEDLQYQLAWYGHVIDPESSVIVRELDMDTLPGKKGEERFGTHPEVKKDKSGKVEKDEIAQVNELYKFDFSHTFLYNDVSEVIGSFVTTVDDKGSTKLFYKPFDAEASHYVQGNILLNSGTTQAIKFAIDDEFECVVKANGKTGKDEGFFDENNNEFIYKQFVKKPFEFRDFHDVKVGLTKA